MNLNGFNKNGNKVLNFFLKKDINYIFFMKAKVT